MAGSVPSKKILHWANVSSSGHAIAQPCRRHTNSEAFQALQELCNVYNVKFGMLHVRENEVSLRKRLGGTAHLRTIEGTRMAGWAISGPWATCGSPQCFQWPAEAFRNNFQLWKFLQFITVGAVLRLTWTETCLHIQ